MAGLRHRCDRFNGEKIYKCSTKNWCTSVTSRYYVHPSFYPTLPIRISLHLYRILDIDRIKSTGFVCRFSVLIFNYFTHKYAFPLCRLGNRYSWCSGKYNGDVPESNLGARILEHQSGRTSWKIRRHVQANGCQVRSGDFDVPLLTFFPPSFFPLHVRI